MGRSLYLDDERRDVEDTLFYGFSSARHGEFAAAKSEFVETREMLDQLINLMAAIELGEVDPDRVEGLAHPMRKGGWDRVDALADLSNQPPEGELR